MTFLMNTLFHMNKKWYDGKYYKGRGAIMLWCDYVKTLGYPIFEVFVIYHSYQ